ncbi:MAG: GNAT family N-acetyltransferase, partial [Bdellovibrionaceae bacterium]|nr:GNAT family N-acetyltransferase [Pseudobdellovibrionaceae bacterium]
MLNALAKESLSRVSGSIQSIYQMRINRLHKFRPKVEFAIDVGPFKIKTVNTLSELKSALKLRYEVFHRELIGKTARNGIDVDEFDFLCDHIVILNKRSDEVIGTYRLNCSLFSNSFYSAREFKIDRVLSHPGVKLELGRACIQKDFRTGVVISLLWRGIAEYMNLTNSQILFGCASVKTKSPREAALLYRFFFESNRLTPHFYAPPTKEYT